MAINFPSNPLDGDTYTFNGITWIYQSSSDVWTSATGQAETLSRIGTYNEKLIDYNYTLLEDLNLVTAGPIEIANTFTVEVPVGTRWAIV
jgi:hypothetical protein